MFRFDKWDENKKPEKLRVIRGGFLTVNILLTGNIDFEFSLLQESYNNTICNDYMHKNDKKCNKLKSNDMHY